MIEMCMVTADPPQTWDSIDRALAIWADWMHGGTVTRGYPRSIPGLRGYTHMDLDSAYEAVDGQLAAAVDALIEGLTPAEQAAVYQRHHLGSFAFPRRNEAALYASAKAKIGEGLLRRGLL